MRPLLRLLHVPFACFALCALLALGLPAHASGEAEPNHLITLHHTSWQSKDGAPPYVTALAQTPDGWLWVGSSVGLFRFDGVRFERFTPQGAAMPSSYVRSLSVLPDGSLWVGYLYGGVSQISNERIVHHYAPRKGGLQGSVLDVKVDAQGQLWAASIVGLFQLKGSDFERAPAEMQAPKSAIQLLNDSQGGLWLRSAQGVYYRAPGKPAFEQQPGEWGWGNLLEARDGSVWGTDTSQGGVRMLRGPLKGTASLQWQPRPGANTQMALDKAGRLWVLREDGVEMLQAGGGGNASRSMSRQQGLSGESGTALLVDREGNIWVGTGNGLDRFRENKLTQYPAAASQGEALPLAVGKDGAIWTDQQWIAHPGAAPERFDPAPPSATNFSLAEYVDPQGRLWTHTLDGLYRVEKTAQGYSRTLIPPPPNIIRALANGLGMDGEGSLWITFGPQLYRLKEGVWLRNGGYDELGKKAYTTIYSDPNGDMWFGATQNTLVRLAQGQVRRFDSKDGISLGTIMQVYRAGKTLWVAGENGLAFFDGTRFHQVLGEGDEPFQSTAGIAQGADGDLWLNGGLGIFRIAAAEQAKLLAEPGYRVHFTHLGYEDGLLGAAPQLGGVRSAVATGGKLWFTTTTGLFWLDPAHTLHNDLPPPVLIKQLAAKGGQGADVPYQPQAGLALPVGSQQLRIDYTALSYTMPERMQFRYKLEGADDAWQDADNRRSAFYTNLAPGYYRFVVQAANNDGVWNNAGASLGFRIAPAWWQTTWFRALALVAVLACIWLLHRVRLLQVAGHMREKLAERLDERERIARELHDTLLQSVHGLVLIFDKAAGHVAANEERQRLERALEVAGAVIEEGRDRVRGLRQDDQAGGLFDSLQQHGSQLAEDSSAEFHATVIGEPRKLHALVSEQFRAIAKEAIYNAFRHASAKHVELQVQYGESMLRVTVRDDGCGIPDAIQQSGARDGHWGLVGMQERARSIKATLSCRSSAAEGTVWQFSIPARLAYEHAPGQGFWRRLLLA